MYYVCLQALINMCNVCLLGRIKMCNGYLKEILIRLLCYMYLQGDVSVQRIFQGVIYIVMYDNLTFHWKKVLL